MEIKSFSIALFINTFFLILISASDIAVDPNGYILYCPCMGRFGNQADHFLGVLGFSKGLNRTLVLPPWVEYRYGETRSIQIPFDTYFQVDALLKYHRVITMEAFMAKLAPYIWPPEKRIAFCFSTRGTSHGCSAKEGNPFGPFWDTFNVDFVGSEFYGPLHYDVHHHDMSDKWNTQYAPEQWPVIAFTGAPASFPVQLENRDLHRYLVWSGPIEKQARHFIQTQLPKGAFIGIHLRNGMDWVRACEHIPHSPNLFAAAQCVGYRNEKGPATADMCLPSQALVVRQLKRIVRNAKNIVALFVASDSNYMIPELTDTFKRMEISVHRLTPPNPHVELAILGRANLFVGNCVSSFSAFVKRERDARGLPSAFWSFPAERTSFGSKHDEL